MSNKQQFLELLESMNQTSREMVDELWEQCEAHYKWLQDVVKTADSMRDRGSIGGDLLPKTPKKRKRIQKVSELDVVLENETAAPLKKAMTMKKCFVKLSSISPVSINTNVMDMKVETLTNMLVDQSVTENIQTSENIEENIMESDFAEFSTNVAGKPTKPPRKLKSNMKNILKENQFPSNGVVPKGIVATQIKMYEEKIGTSFSPQKLPNQSSVGRELLCNLSASKNNANNANDATVLEAKINELQISRMSTSRRRSSRMRCKLNASKAVLRRSSCYANIGSGGQKSVVASLSNSLSSSFVTATSSPVLAENNVENYDGENLSQTSEVMNVDESVEVASKSATDGSDIQTTQDITDHGEIEVVMETPPSQRQTKAKPTVETVVVSKTLSNAHIAASASKRPFPLSTASSSLESMKNRQYSVKNGIFGVKRQPSASPTGSLYRYGFTPDRTMTPQSNNLRLEMIANLDAKAESVLKKRDEALRLRVEEQKRKRELRLQKVAQAKERREKERAAKIVKLQEEEKKKAHRKKLKEEKQKLIETEQMRQYKLRLEEQRLNKEKEQEAEKHRLVTVNVPKLEVKLLQQSPKNEVFVLVQDILTCPGPHKANPNATYNAGDSALNATYNAGNSTLNATYNAESYEMTPKNRPTTLKNPENYDIDNLKEDDSTDEEGQPKKPIPIWAQGRALSEVSYKQWLEKPNYALVFPRDELFVLPNLNTVFKTRRKRFYHRTSSATWTRPILPN